jgi:hypothetical protein
MQLFFRALLVAAIVLGGTVFVHTYPSLSHAQSTSASADPVLVGAGDISKCSHDNDEATAKLLDTIPGTVFTLGDNVYGDGTLAEFTDCYRPTWGRHKDRTRPSPGNHDYHVPGAAGYYTYFGKAASPLDNNCTSHCKGYYSYDLGEWHIIVLNSEIDMSANSPQVQWLRSDLAANPKVCTLAYWHNPRFSSGRHGNSTKSASLWDALYAAGADVILNGHDHTYERFAPQNPNGQADAKGIREFVVGTGGAGLYPFGSPLPNSEVRNNQMYGVLKLTLHPTSYDWQFVPVAGQTFTDAGSANCVGAGAPPTVTPVAPPTGTPMPTPTGTPVSSENLIFADSFESGTLSAWSTSSTGGGDLSVKPAAALVGSQGLQAVINGTNAIYLTDNKPTAESRYRARFYFDPNSIVMANGHRHFIFKGFSDTSRDLLRVEYRFSDGAYQLRTALLNDGTTWRNSSWFRISDATHAIELDWRAATAAGTNNGSLAFWIDGVQKANLTGVDNDTHRIDRVRLGALSGIDTGTRGTYFFDAFESRRQTYIGLAPGVQVAVADETALDAAELQTWTEEEDVPEENGEHQLLLPLVQD